MAFALCPVARSLEVLGDQWTLLIVRDMFGGVSHFNELERGLPGISRASLSQRLRQLQRAGVVKKHAHAGRRQSTEYQLTQAGHELEGVIGALTIWCKAWAFADPEPAELDPVLLMWWLRADVASEHLPQGRVVVQFDFQLRRKVSFWLILTRTDVTLCLTDPGFETDLVVTADLAALYKLWWGQLTYRQVLGDQSVTLAGSRRLVQQFPNWFNWSAAQHMHGVRAMRRGQVRSRNEPLVAAAR